MTWDNSEVPKPIKFADLTKAYRLHPDKGFPVVFSVSDVKVRPTLHLLDFDVRAVFNLRPEKQRSGQFGCQKNACST